MERCNARTMEIYRRMGIVEKVRAAGLPARRARWTCSSYFAGRAAADPPAYPSVAEAKARIAAMPRRHAAARALPADLAVHARAAAQVDRRAAAERHGAVRLRAGGVRRRTQAGVTAPRAQMPTARPEPSARSTWSAATAARAGCASSSASSCPGRPTAAAAPGAVSTAKTCTSASRSARAGTITWRTRARPS